MSEAVMCSKTVKRRHLTLGLGIVLVLSAAVPALGGPLAGHTAGSKQAKSVARIKSVARKTLKTAAAAQQAAEAAQSAASRAQRAVSSAQNAADTAQRTADSANSMAIGAQAVADVATTEAERAQKGAESVLPKVVSVEATVTKATMDAQSAVNRAAEKFRGVIPTESTGGGTSLGSNEKEAFVTCSSNTFVAGGGFKIRAGAAEPHRVQGDLLKNRWLVRAQSGGNPFSIQSSALCLAK